MSTTTTIHRVLALFMSLCLILSGTALAGGGGSGKKNFKEGLKYEELQQWDLAAQQFALAVAAEPKNAEYKLHYARALQQASVMYMKRGDDLAEQNDYAGAFAAYRSAWSYDQGNEIARLKMERMLEQQKAQASGIDPGKINGLGNVRPTSNEIQVATKARSRDVVQSISFKEAKFKTVITNLGRQLGLNVVFDESVKDQPINIDLSEVTVSKALDIIFKTYKYSFEQVDRRTILIYADNPTNRPRFESLMVKTFYLGNISGNQARTVVQGMLPPGRIIQTLDQGQTQGGNLLVVKATQTELQLVQDIISTLDKNKNEVMMDVEIYEINKGASDQIGNSLLGTPPQGGSVNNGAFSLANFGGFGFEGQRSGALFGLPTTTLSLFSSKSNSKLLYKTQVHALDGQKNSTKVGSRVPVRVGSTYTGTSFLNQGGGQNNPANNVPGFNNGIVDNIQYQDVGLVIEAKPTITNEGYIEVEMKFDSTDVVASTTGDPLNPTFTQRTLQTTSRMQDGVTAVVAGVNQDRNINGRTGVPVISMVPLVGRLFGTPNNQNNNTDIIITVTPHIKRSQGINKDDYLARSAGSQQGGPAPTVEEVVYRAQQEEEQERRLVAQQLPSQALPPQTLPINGAQATTVAASQVITGPPATSNPNPNPGLRNENQQTIQPVSFSSNPARSAAQQPATGTKVERPVPGLVPSPTVPIIIPQQQSENQTGESEVIPQENTEPPKEEEQVQSMAKAQTPYVSPGLVMVQRPENLVNASRSTPAVVFSLSPKPIQQQQGKTVTVVVEVNSQTQMTGANITLKFDPSKLKFKTVRDGGLLGAQPAYEVESGSLVIKLNQPKSVPVNASGRLVTIDFAAVAEGQSEIVFSSGGNQLRMANDSLAQASGSPTQVIVTRQPAISVTNER